MQQRKPAGCVFCMSCHISMSCETCGLVLLDLHHLTKDVLTPGLSLTNARPTSVTHC